MAKKGKLSIKDRKIVAVLAENSRYSMPSIAKLTGLSREVVSYRIKKLLEKEVIKNFSTYIKHNKIGYERYVLGIRLQNCNQEEEEEIIKNILDNFTIEWMGRTTGNDNFILEICTKDVFEFAEKLYRVLALIGDKLNNYTIERDIDFEFYGYKFLKDESVKHKKIVDKNSFQSEFSKPLIPLNLIDKTDLKITKLLVNNARMKINEISKFLKINPKTIKKRIKALIRGKVITNFTVELNFQTKLGLRWYYVDLRLKNTNIKNLNSMKTYLRNHKLIPWSSTYIGDLSFSFCVFVKKYSELEEIMGYLRSKFKDTILDYKIADVLREYIFNPGPP